MKTIVQIGMLLIGFTIQLSAQVPQIKWWYDVNDASFGQSAAGDIDGDGSLEVVFGCYRNDSTVYALNANNGTLLWKYNTHPASAEGCNDVAPLIFNVDDDATVEVIVPSSCNPKTFCFNGPTGTVKWECNTRGSDSPPVIADLDQDGILEIAHGEFGGYVKCINALNGSEKWELPVDLNSWIQTAPTVVDLDQNGVLDFVVGTWNFDGNDSVYAFRGDNQSRLWAYPIHDYMYHGTAVADLDMDQKPELVIGSYNDTLYCINGENGTTNWTYKANGGYIGSPATIADINDDYYPDIIFGTTGGKVITLNGNNGSLIWSLDLAAHVGNSNFEFDHAPIVADFDQDDTLDIFIVGGHAEYPDFQNNYGRAYLISAGKGKGPDWLMFQNNRFRNSSLCPFNTNTIQESTEDLSFSIYPNPTSGSVTVSVLNEDHFQIEIVNKLGQVLYQTIVTNNMKMDISFLKHGLYFIRIQTENQKFGIKKLMIQ
jgi:outer membrane protein assembly factor BamB